MFKEYFRKAEADQAAEISWHSIMPGIEICHFSLMHPSDDESLSFCPRMTDLPFEIFFCRKGTLILSRNSGRPITIGKNEIFLLSDSESFRNARVTAPIEGFLILINSAEALEKLQTIAGPLDVKDSYISCIHTLFDQHDGYIHLADTVWNRSLFSALDLLPLKDQHPYCMIKVLELFYLLYTKSSLLTLTSDYKYSSSNSFLVQTIKDMQAYMKEHLDEKLTISILSRKFHISPTACKSGFRQVSGQPIHAWLQSQRMEKAAGLLYSSPMTVLQVAQSVGFEGACQFNIIFKRHFGVTPSQYRKMSDSVNFHPFP